MSLKSLIGKTELKTAWRPVVLALLRLDPGLEEALERLLLDLDQIRDVEDPGDLREVLADAGCVLGELDLAARFRSRPVRDRAIE